VSVRLQSQGLAAERLRHFAVSSTDHRTHAEQHPAIAGSVRRRDVRARPKSHFAINSPIREPDCKIEVA
jgi:hypothetical protein